MNVLFAVAAAVAIVSTILVIVQHNAVHALLYLIVSLFAVAVIFLLLGAPFVAALEVIVYAGAIMVLFIFAVMLIGASTSPVRPSAWIAPSVLGVVLLAEIVFVLFSGTTGSLTAMQLSSVSPKQVGISLLGRYVLGIEVAAFILLAGLVGAYHLGRRKGE
jgi:NADH-quinone oxidoreductase subunit J